jgi:pyridoxal phosphate enzyme (YggS family)
MLLCWMPSEKSKSPSSVVSDIIQVFRQKSGLRLPLPKIVIASKNQPSEKILPLLKGGHQWFGENRVQEAANKWPLLKQNYPSVRLHLIGSLQTNKVRQALSLFDVIETIDRPELVGEIVKEWRKCPNPPEKLLIQVNTCREPQKNGVLVENLPSLIAECRKGSLPLTGLMTIPSLQENPFPHFQLLARLARDFGLSDLSMGMSNDYLLAITAGATWVRLGKAVWSQ